MRYLFLHAIIAIFAISVGCNFGDNSTSKGTGTTPASHSHSHDDDHDHDHVSSNKHDDEPCCQHGPYGGILFEFDNDQYKGEFVESKVGNTIRFYILNANEEDVSLKVNSFTITPEAGNDSTSIEIEVESPDADGKSHVYFSDDKHIKTALRTGAKVEIKAGDLVLSGRVEAHEHSGH